MPLSLADFPAALGGTKENSMVDLISHLNHNVRLVPRSGLSGSEGRPGILSDTRLTNNKSARCSLHLADLKLGCGFLGSADGSFRSGWPWPSNQELVVQVCNHEGQQGHFSGSLDGSGDHSLLLGSVARLARRNNLSSFGQEASKKIDVLIVDIFDFAQGQQADSASLARLGAAIATAFHHVYSCLFRSWINCDFLLFAHMLSRGFPPGVGGRCGPNYATSCPGLPNPGGPGPQIAGPLAPKSGSA